MSSLANPPSAQPPQYPHSVSDEIDLKELVTALWQGKWLIIISTLIFTLAAIGYALTAQEWWSAKATVSQPQLQGIASYQQTVKRYQPLFDVYQEDGSIIVSETLDLLTDPEVIFKRFIQEFNANGTKRRFMKADPTFLRLQKQLLIKDDSEVLQQFHEEWFKRIAAVSVDKKTDKEYTLSFQSIDRASSLTLLNQYVVFVGNIINQQLHNDLANTLMAKFGELKQQEQSLLQQAKLRLQAELERTKLALTIAEAAEIKQPVQNLGTEDIFAINIGSRALKAKVDALKSINDLSLFEPRLTTLQSKLSLEKTNGNDTSLISSFYYLDQPEQPLTRDRPKRTLVVVLGFLLGGMFGVAVVLVRSVFRKEEK